MAESLGQKRLMTKAERGTVLRFLEAAIRLLLDSSLEVRATFISFLLSFHIDNTDCSSNTGCFVWSWKSLC